MPRPRGGESGSSGWGFSHPPPPAGRPTPKKGPYEHILGDGGSIGDMVSRVWDGGALLFRPADGGAVAMSLTVGSLFSGIGGFDKGLQDAGMKIRWQVEINEWCRKVLTKHWLEVPKYGDIRALDWSTVAPVDLLCGGFPCQPFSVAGKRQGADDDRNMWPEFRRAVAALKPRWVLGENVSGAKSYIESVVLPDLEALGYETAVLGIPACALGAPHRRERLWIVAWHPNGWNRDQREKQEMEGRENTKPTRICPNVSVTISARGGRGATPREIGHERWATGQEGRTGLQPQDRKACTDHTQQGSEDVADHDQLRMEREGSQQQTTRFDECNRLHRWSTEPNVGRVVDGLSLELDFTRRIARWCDEQSDNSQKKPTRNVLTGKLLRAMWEYQGLATASRELYVRKLQDSVPEVPLLYPHDRWLLGARIKENQGLRDLLKAFYSQPLQEAQDMQFKLLERAWEEKRQKTVGSRVDRLRGLGNAVVPQIVEWIGRMIMEVERGDE